MHVIEFKVGFYMAEFSPVTLLNGDATIEALEAAITIMVKFTRNIYEEVS